MVNVEIVGYKKIEKGGREIYYLSCLSEETEKGSEGLTTYNTFVSAEHLKKHKVPENLIGLTAQYYNVKDGDAWKSGITFKNYSTSERSIK